MKSEPEPWTVHHKPYTLHLKPKTFKSLKIPKPYKPYTFNDPKFVVLDLSSLIFSLEPWTVNLKPQKEPKAPITRNFESWTLNSEP